MLVAGRAASYSPDARIVEVVEFETADPAMHGESTITI